MVKRVTVYCNTTVRLYSNWGYKDILIKAPKDSVWGISGTSLDEESIQYSLWILMIHHIYCLVRVIHVAAPIRRTRKCKIGPLAIINILLHINPQRMLSVSGYVCYKMWLRILSLGLERIPELSQVICRHFMWGTHQTPATYGWVCMVRASFLLWHYWW